MENKNTTSIIETVKPDVAPQEILKARDKTWEAVRCIAAAIKHGIVQREVLELGKSILADMGAIKHWHRPNIHLGSNTKKFYGDKSVDPEVKLGVDDIYYIDIGPVWQSSEAAPEVEGDAGATFVTGSDPEMLACAADAKHVFDRVKDKWSREKIHGKDLYDFAAKTAKAMGWQLNVDANGHRISDFPHALYFKGGFTDIDFTPTSHLWVLEIHLLHPTQDFGAFYEDVIF